MKRLARALFERDLSEVEWDRLLKTAQDSPEFAMEIAEEAGRFAQAAGLKADAPALRAPYRAPRWLGTKAGWGPLLPALAIGVFGGLGWLHLASPGPAAGEAPAPAPAAAGAGAVQEPGLWTKSPGPDPVRPSQDNIHPSMELKVEGGRVIAFLSGQPGAAAKLELLSEGGQVLRRLWQGRLSRRQVVAAWDQELERGLMAHAGVYFFRLKQGEASESRAVEIKVVQQTIIGGEHDQEN